MAITNAQQYKQILQKEREEKAFGGVMGIDGRKAYVGGSYRDPSPSNKGQGSGLYQGGSKAPGSAESIGGGRDGPDPDTADPFFRTRPDDKPKTIITPDNSNNKKPLNIPDFKTAAKKSVKFLKKQLDNRLGMIYNFLPSNPELSYQYIDQLSEEEYKDLPQSLKDRFETLTQGYEIESGQTNLKDLNKLPYDEYSFLANDPKFQKYAYDRGKPALKESGNVGGLGDKFVKKDPITGETLKDQYGQTLYGYDPVRDGDGGGMSDYERRLLELEQAVAAATGTPEVEEDQIVNYRLMADGGRAALAEGGMPYEGGIMDLETSRQMYGLGKFVKKITRGVKKVIKSPIGKAALGAALFRFGPGLLKGGGQGSIFSKLFGANNTMKGFANISTAKMPGFLSKIGLTQGYGSMMPTALGGILGSSALSYFMTPKEEDDNEELYAGADLPNPVEYYLSGQYTPNRRLAAEGGSMDEPEPVAKKTMPLLDMDGKEMDLRDEGGFVPLGRMERADDVPARLSKNEFVFTADAVRNAGEGDVDKGAEVMYNMMKNLESGGEVSEESQGLEGAREMFQTSQRLEEVI